MTKGKTIVIANWKMHPDTHTEASQIFDGIKECAKNLRNVQTVICPPFPFIDKLAMSYEGHRILFGGQDVFYEESGAYTGEISASMLYSVGSDYCIVGHSERRALGETDEDVSKKATMLLSHKITPILCVGESERDHGGKYLDFLRKQIGASLHEAKKKDLSKIILAYEPIWAIGKTGDEAVTGQQVHETVLYVKRVIREEFGNKIADDMTIIYGGSVNPDNAYEILEGCDVAGFLVGGASLRPEQFNQILTTADNYKCP